MNFFFFKNFQYFESSRQRWAAFGGLENGQHVRVDFWRYNQISYENKLFPLILGIGCNELEKHDFSLNTLYYIFTLYLYYAQSYVCD